jgi:uncharacterized protein DUF4404
MDRNLQLREQLERLDAELKSIESVDDASREVLQRVQEDVQNLLLRSGTMAPPQEVSITARLRQGIQHFEVTHPNLVAMMEQVVNTLSEMGI